MSARKRPRDDTFLWRLARKLARIPLDDFPRLAETFHEVAPFEIRWIDDVVRLFESILFVKWPIPDLELARSRDDLWQTLESIYYPIDRVISLADKPPKRDQRLPGPPGIALLSGDSRYVAIRNVTGEENRGLLQTYLHEPFHHVRWAIDILEGRMPPHPNTIATRMRRRIDDANVATIPALERSTRQNAYEDYVHVTHERWTNRLVSEVLKPSSDVAWMLRHTSPATVRKRLAVLLSDEALAAKIADAFPSPVRTAAWYGKLGGVPSQNEVGSLERCGHFPRWFRPAQGFSAALVSFERWDTVQWNHARQDSAIDKLVMRTLLSGTPSSLRIPFGPLGNVVCIGLPFRGRNASISAIAIATDEKDIGVFPWLKQIASSNRYQQD